LDIIDACSNSFRFPIDSIDIYSEYSFNQIYKNETILEIIFSLLIDGSNNIFKAIIYKPISNWSIIDILLLFVLIVGLIMVVCDDLTIVYIAWLYIANQTDGLAIKLALDLFLTELHVIPLLYFPDMIQQFFDNLMILTSYQLFFPHWMMAKQILISKIR